MTTKPSLVAMVPVVKTSGSDTHLKAAGVAWEFEKDGKPYITIQLDLIPVHGWTGKILLFPNDRSQSDGAPF